MINIIIQKSDAQVGNTETLTSGTANAVYVRFSLSDHWDNLHKTAVFTNGEKTVNILDDAWLSENVCAVPHEVLAEPGRIIRVGLRGTRQRDLILATPMFSIGKVIPGADAAGDTSTMPTLPVWEQLREDFSKRSYACTTVMEKFYDDVWHSTIIRVRLKNIDNIPAGAALHLYRCIRNRGAHTHWEHPVTWNGTPKDRHQKWGYGLIAGEPFANDGNILYPTVPTWMPNNGFMKTEQPITDLDKVNGYIDFVLSTYLIPLLKPIDADSNWEDCGFVGLQGNGRDNSLLLRFRICMNGVPIDDPGDTLRIGFRKKSENEDTVQILAKGRICTSGLYTSIR